MSQFVTATTNDRYLQIPWSSPPTFHSIIYYHFTISFLMLPKLRNWYIIIKSLNTEYRVHDFNFGHPKWKGMMKSSPLCCWGFRSFKMWCCVNGDHFPAFQSSAEPSSSLTLKMKAWWSFKTSRVAHQMTHCHIPEDVNLLHQLCRLWHPFNTVSYIVLLCLKTWWWCMLKYCLCHILNHASLIWVNGVKESTFACFCFKKMSCVGWWVLLYLSV